MLTPRESSTGQGPHDYEGAATVTERALRASQTSERALAYSSGISQSRVRAFVEPERRASLSLARLAYLAGDGHRSAFVAAVARELLELAQPSSGPGLSPLAHVALAVKELGELAARTTEAGLDGVYDAREREGIACEARQAIAALEALVKDLES